MSRRVFIIAFTLLLAACASPIVTSSQMAAVLHYSGFAVRRPADAHWFLVPGEQQQNRAFFHYEQPSPTHTFFAQVTRYEMPANPARPEEFKKNVDLMMTRHGPRHEILSYESSLGEKQGQTAVYFRLKVLDKEPANSNAPLVMTMVGFVAIHPGWPNSVVDAEYSERGTEAEVDGTLDLVGGEFLNAVLLQTPQQVDIGGN